MKNASYNPAEKPIINNFIASKTKVKNEESFTLSWNVENADKIELHKNDILIKLDIDRKSIDLRDYFDSEKKESSYVLVAFNKDKETKSDPIIISLFNASESAKKPVIKQFYADKTNVKNEEAFTLKWDVENAGNVELYKNDTLIRLDAGQKSIVLRDYFGDDKKESSYVLIAYNGELKTRSNPVIVSRYEIVVPVEKKPLIRYFGVSKVEVKSEERITLNWDVDNADNVELYKNDVPIKLNAEQKVIDLIEYFDKEREANVYALVAYNGSTKVRSNPVVVRLSSGQGTSYKPVISEFVASKTRVEDQEKFTLRWEVKNAEKLELYKDGVLVDQLSNTQKSIEVKAIFVDDKGESSYMLVAYNEAEKETKIIVLQKSGTQAPSLITKILLLLTENKNILVKAMILLSALVASFIIYKLISPKRSEFYVNKKIMHEGSDITIRTRNLRDTAGLHILFNSTEGKKVSFVSALLSVKVPHIDSLAPDDLVNVSILRHGKQYYQTKLSYVQTKLYDIKPFPPHRDTSGSSVTPHNEGSQYPVKLKPIYKSHSISSTKYDLITYAHLASWSQVVSRPQEGPVDRMLPWEDRLQNGSAGTRTSKMEDGTTYRVLQIYPVSMKGGAVYAVLGSFLLHGTTGKKIFTAKVGFVSGSGAESVNFEIRATNIGGKLIGKKQYAKTFDNTVKPLKFELPSSTPPDYRLQLVITGSESGVASAGWIDPLVASTSQ